MSAKLDIITLRGLTAEGIHGVFEFEHAAPQPFVIDLALWVDTTDAITSDDIADTVSYADVANDVVSVVEGPSAHLIETLAQRISDVLLANPRVEGVEVTVHKPKAPLEQEFTDVAITVRRGHTPGTISRIRDITVVDGKVSPEADEPLVSFGGPDEASALPSFSPTGSVSLQGIDIPSRTQARSQAQVHPPVSGEPAQSAPIQATSSKQGVAPVLAEHPFVLALGGNVGDVPVTLAQAVSSLIDIPGVQITDVSPLLRTHAVLAPGQAPQNDHWNAVVIGRTTLEPHDFFARTSSIETSLGRVRHEHWGPRRIDIDIISMGDLRVDDATLTIPHPRAHLRAFVLAPWLLTDPEAVLPGHGPIEALLAASADIQGIIDAVDDWLESPEGIQAESDTLVAAQNATRATTPAAPVNEAYALVDDADNEPTRDRPEHSQVSTVKPMSRVADLARPLVIPPIAVPTVAEPLAVSRLDRLDPSSKERLQPDQGADLLWHKVWNSWAQTPIDPEEVADREGATPPASVEASPAQPSPAVPASEPFPHASLSQESMPKPVPAVVAPPPTRSVAEGAPRLNFVVAPDKPVEQTSAAPASSGDSASTADAFPEELSRSRMSRRNAHAASQSSVAQPLPFQQVLVDDAVLEENPGQRHMRWAPIHSYDASSASSENGRHDAGKFASRVIPHPDVPLSTPVADEAEARAELARIEAARAAEAAQAERVRQEQEVRALRERERREQEARAAALAQEDAIRLEVARLERERQVAAARAAAEREASVPPLPKRQAQFAPLRAESPRDPSEHEGAQRPLPQWDFSSSHVTIVDDSVDTGAATGSHSSVLAPDLPEGTPTGAVAEVNGQTGMLSRVTMRPTATGMIPVVKRDSTHP